MNHPTFLELPSQTQSALASLSSAVADVVPIDVRTWQIDVSTLPLEKDRLQLIQEVSKWAGQSKACLYYFECRSPSIDLAEVERVFADAKAHETNDRAYPRLNISGKCFYVGSSQSVAKRLTEHLGYGAKKTYALQLIHWSRPLSLHLELVCAKYPESTPSDVVQTLEDTLWKTKAPMFGRQGRK
jgi:hypothetical protein